MRKFFVAMAVAAGMGSAAQAVAATPADIAPAMRAYVNFAFGGDHAQALGLHYGLRMDHDRRFASAERPQPAVAQMDFTAAGFDNAMVNGVPFVRHIAQVNQSEEQGGGGTSTSYSFVDWGLLAVGVAGVGFGIAEVSKTHDSPDPSAGGAKSSSTSTSSSGTCAPSTAPAPIGGQCAPSVPGVGLAATAALNAERADPRYLQWLDGGTGHMGDLIAR